MESILFFLILFLWGILLIKIILIIYSSFTRKSKIIVFTGTIGAGKTSCAKLFERYLKQKGFSVYRYIEASLEVPEELELFYDNPAQNSLFFQYVIMNLYEKRALLIKKLKFDYIIEDRTIKDVNIFNKFIENDKARNYVNKKVSEVEYIDPYKVVYVKPSVKTTIKRRKQRNRSGEKCNIEYLRQLYSEYENDINIIYPEHIVFENEVVLCKNCLDFLQCKNKKKCDLKSYEIFFNQLL